MQEVNHGSLVIQPEDPIKEGYDFLTWQLNEEDYNFSTLVTGPIELKATWDLKRYVIKFDTDGGSNVDYEIKVHNSILARPEDPTKEGFTFDNWYLLTNNQLDEEPFDFTTRITKSITLKAKWIENE